MQREKNSLKGLPVTKTLPWFGLSDALEGVMLTSFSHGIFQKQQCQ